jgi:hypothetical protein
MRIETRTFMFKGEEQKQVKLFASVGMVLTQKQLAEDEDPIYSTMIFLGKNDSADNYIEITEREAEERQRVAEEKRKEEEVNGES